MERLLNAVLQIFVSNIDFLHIQARAALKIPDTQGSNQTTRQQQLSSSSRGYSTARQPQQPPPPSRNPPQHHSTERTTPPLPLKCLGTQVHRAV